MFFSLFVSPAIFVVGEELDVQLLLSGGSNELDIRKVPCSPKMRSQAVAIEKLITGMYLTRLGKNTPLYLYPQHGSLLKIFA